MGGRGERSVAPPAAPSPGDQNAPPGRGQVGGHGAPLVPHHRPRRRPNREIVAVVTRPIAALAVPSAIGLEAALEAEGVETLQRGVGNQVHRPAIPARPSVGAAARDEFLAPETDAAVAPVSSDDHDLGLINQHVAPAPATAGRFLTTDDAARRMERREPSVRGLLKAFRRGDAGSGSAGYGRAGPAAAGSMLLDFPI